jgi:hypothetical protein
MLAKMIMISALVCSSQPMMLASPGAHLSMRPAMRSEQLAADRRDEQDAGGDEHRLAAERPVGAQAGAEEEDRHDNQQHMVAQQIHPFLIEPLGVHDCSGQEGADHEVQARPVGTEGADGQPDQATCQRSRSTSRRISARKA